MTTKKPFATQSQLYVKNTGTRQEHARRSKTKFTHRMYQKLKTENPWIKTRMKNKKENRKKREKSIENETIIDACKYKKDTKLNVSGFKKVEFKSGAI